MGAGSSKLLSGGTLNIRNYIRPKKRITVLTTFHAYNKEGKLPNLSGHRGMTNLFCGAAFEASTRLKSLCSRTGFLLHIPKPAHAMQKDPQ